MENFAAIDFETANGERTSVCAVGVVIVRGGVVVDSFYSLIKPEPNYYNYWCSRVHGLSRADTDDAPIFPDVWAMIEPRIQGLPLVAHNKAFDFSKRCAILVHTSGGASQDAQSPQSSITHRGGGLWLSHHSSSPCSCRCRGLCRDSFRNIIGQFFKNSLNKKCVTSHSGEWRISFVNNQLCVT